nr:JAB domain-containing protein [Bacillus sp. NTK034]
MAVHHCHIGSLDWALISPREVFKACILNNARKIIVAHTIHPLNLIRHMRISKSRKHY